MEVNITNENFEKEVLEYKGTVIVDFYGTWCMPCKMMAPVLHKISDEQNVKLALVDIDENDELTKEYRVMAVPTIKVFKDGKEVATFVGVTNEAKILEVIK